MKKNTPEEDLFDKPMTDGGNVMAPLRLDPDEYRVELAKYDLTPEQENELLQSLWHIMSIMVDIGWGVDTVQMFLPDLFEKDSQDSGELVEHKDTQNSFNQSANNNAEKDNRNGK